MCGSGGPPRDKGMSCEGSGRQRAKRRFRAYLGRDPAGKLHKYYGQVIEDGFQCRRGFDASMSLTHDRTFREPINVFTTTVMVLFHIGAVAALFFFTWKGLLLEIGRASCRER